MIWWETCFPTHLLSSCSFICAVVSQKIGTLFFDSIFLTIVTLICLKYSHVQKMNFEHNNQPPIAQTICQKTAKSNVQHYIPYKENDYHKIAHVQYLERILSSLLWIQYGFRCFVRRFLWFESQHWPWKKTNVENISHFKFPYNLFYHNPWMHFHQLATHSLTFCHVIGGRYCIESAASQK